LEIKIRENSEQPLTVKHEILKVNLKEKSFKLMKDEIVTESQIEFYLNNERYAVFSFSPSDIKELIIGHLLAEGIIERTDLINSLDISENRVYVYLNDEVKLTSSEKPRVISTECSGNVWKIPVHIWMKLKGSKDASSMIVSSETIVEAAKMLNSLAKVYRRTGGTHASALLDENGELLALSEDISRRNAVDKTIGKAALKGVDFRRTLLASTGRLTSDIVIKAANVGIPIIASISAPTDKGIKIAEMTRLTLVGFTRGKRFNIYTHPERIKKSSEDF